MYASISLMNSNQQLYMSNIILIKMINQIKEAFVNRLDDLGVTDKYFANLNNRLAICKDPNELIDKLNNSVTFSAFITESFYWPYTEEGNDFWMEIADK